MTDRYHRQTLLPQIGAAGQERLARSRALLVGCGALGTVVAEQLVRAGLGLLLIADRDIVELTNLQRQVLFDEADAQAGLPKAVAAAHRLARVNSTVRVEALVTDVHAGNIESLAGFRGPVPVDLILDGTDNVQTRYLINDVAVKHNRPWIYGAAVAAEGRVMTVRPHVGPCLRCLYPQPPRPQDLPTCDTAGVLGPAAAAIAALQALAAIKLLTGSAQAVGSELLAVDFWANRFSPIGRNQGPRPDCPCCGRAQFDFLAAGPGDLATTLCGRASVQVRPVSALSLDLEVAAHRLAGHGQVRPSPYCLRCSLNDPPGISLTLFPDGRLLVHGTQDTGRARSLYARFVGS